MKKLSLLIALLAINACSSESNDPTAEAPTKTTNAYSLSATQGEKEVEPNEGIRGYQKIAIVIPYHNCTASERSYVLGHMSNPACGGHAGNKIITDCVSNGMGDYYFTTVTTCYSVKAQTEIPIDNGPKIGEELPNVTPDEGGPITGPGEETTTEEPEVIN